MLLGCRLSTLVQPMANCAMSLAYTSWRNGSDWLGSSGPLLDCTITSRWNSFLSAILWVSPWNALPALYRHGLFTWSISIFAAQCKNTPLSSSSRRPNIPLHGLVSSALGLWKPWWVSLCRTQYIVVAHFLKAELCSEFDHLEVVELRWSEGKSTCTVRIETHVCQGVVASKPILSCCAMWLVLWLCLDAHSFSLLGYVHLIFRW